MITSLITHDSGYLSHLGLSHNPFPVVPDDTCIFLSGRIEQIVAEIVHGVVARKGFMMLTGDIGLGKTTISRRIISILEEKGIETALVLHTSLQDAELLQEINRDFGIETIHEKGRPASLGEQLRQLNEFLLEQNRQGKNCAIIIDDAQNLNQQSLELVRMISNLEGERRKLVQILLIGQPELAERLNTYALRQLRSRVVITAEVKPLNRQELKEYIHFKLNAAGNHGQASVTSWAAHKIYQYTRGNFRLVNMLMDRCLYVTCLQNLRVITPGVVKVAHKDLFPKTSLKMTRRLATVIATLLLLGFVGWGQLGDEPTPGIFGSRLNRSFTELNKPEVKVVKITPEVPPAVVSNSEIGEAELKQDQIHDAFAEFFKPFGLSGYAEKFQGALFNGELDAFADGLLQDTGYQLIGLREITPAIQHKFGVLSIPAVPAGGQRHYVLWRPPIRIKNFYYSYQGAEINSLQSLLAGVNLYHDRLDNIVGPRLMRAVVDFQKQNHLPLTGFPDPRTLFFLFHTQEGTPIG